MAGIDDPRMMEALGQWLRTPEAQRFLDTADAQNPESVLDRSLIEQLQSGEMLNTSATGGTRIRTREDAAAAEQRSADAGKIAAMVLAVLIGGAGASRSGAAFTGRLGDRAGFQHGGVGTGMRSVRGALNPRSADYLGPDAWMARSAQQPWGYTIGGNMVPPVAARVPASAGWLGPAAAAGGIQAARQGAGAGQVDERPGQFNIPDLPFQDRRKRIIDMLMMQQMQQQQMQQPQMQQMRRPI